MDKQTETQLMAIDEMISTLKKQKAWILEQSKYMMFASQDEKECGCDMENRTWCKKHHDEMYDSLQDKKEMSHNVSQMSHKQDKCVVCNDTELKEGFCHDCKKCWDCCGKKCQVPNNDEKNPAHYCMGHNCKKYLGHRGFCSDKCHDESYDSLPDKSEPTVEDEIKKELQKEYEKDL